MKFDVVLACVGGQGGLSVASIIAQAALEEGFFVKQTEVHGMSQRGGAVVANLRLSDRPVASPLIPQGGASLLLSMEPLEALRHLSYLGAEGTLITATMPVVNIPDYPDVQQLLDRIRSFPRSLLVEAEPLARQAGSAAAGNVVMAGAASHLLPIRPELLQRSVERFFGRKGARVVEMNMRAFSAGKQAFEQHGA